MEPGSESGSIKQLEPLLEDHEHCNHIRTIMSDGVDYKLSDLPEKETISDLTHMMDRGNHESASDLENTPTLIKNHQKEVDYGWMLPITMEYVPKIKGASVIPVGVAPQFTIDANGDKKVKRRTTHDSSFHLPSKQSSNERMNRDLLVKCFYGHCLLRILHAIHIMR